MLICVMGLADSALIAKTRTGWGARRGVNWTDTGIPGVKPTTNAAPSVYSR